MNSSVFADVGRGNGKGGPDGMCVDSEGNLYAAIYTGGVVRVVSPDGSAPARHPGRWRAAHQLLLRRPRSPNALHH